MLLLGTTALLAGLVVGAYLPYLPSVLLASLVLAAIALSILERRGACPARRGLVLYAIALAGILLWTVVAADRSQRALLGASGEDPIEVIGTVVDPVRHGPARAVALVAVSQLGRGSAAEMVEGRVRLSWRDPDRALRRGDRIAFRARLRPPSGTANPGGFDYAAYLKRKHVHAVASVTGPGQVTRLESGCGRLRWAVWCRIDGWRDRIRQAADTSLAQPALGFYLGIITGERDYLDPELRDRFMATGTVHILSISGSHLGLVAFLCFFLVRRGCRSLPPNGLLFVSRWLTPARLAALLTVCPVTFYAVLAGAEVATVRALLMILVFLAAVWLGYANQLLHALAAAAVLILAHDPEALFDISFQLSFVSVLAIALVFRWRHRHRDVDVRGPESMWAQGIRWLREYLWITGAVTLATIPLVAYHFNQIAWLGLLANLIVVPLTGFVLVPLGLLSACILLVVGGDTLPVAWANQQALDATSWVVERLAYIPGAEWHVASPAVPAIVGFYVLVVLGCRPGVARSVRVALAGMVAVLVFWWAWSPRFMGAEDTLRVTFLDVGQGDACVIELPEGQTVLIDGGAAYERLDMGRSVVAPYLWDRGIRHLDLVIGTHPQLDHIGGLPWIIKKFEVEQYRGSGVPRNRLFYTRLRGALRSRGVVERSAGDGEELLSTPSCRLWVLNPPGQAVMGLQPSQAVSSGTLLNNLSVVTRLDCGSHSFLFAGDIESATMTRLIMQGAPIEARVLKVPHHGARSSRSPDWAEKVGAELAVISVGRNPYRHPSWSVIQDYQRAGTALRRTDRDGAVSIVAQMTSRAMAIQAARSAMPQPLQVGAFAWSSELRNVKRIWASWLDT